MRADETGMVRSVSEQQADTGREICLENGVTLHLRQDGSAWGSDGRDYYPILQERREIFEGHQDVFAHVIGWSSELSQEKVFPPRD